MSAVRIATRGSDLALAQARTMARRIEQELNHSTELLVLTTTGDRIQDVSLSKIGGKGLFIKEIEQALLDRRADVAVHSAKDLPADLADGLVLAAFPERADPRDALVTGQSSGSIEDLPHGGRVGTGSTRRIAQLLALRPDLEIVPLRGNVPTRLGKIETESLDAVILASAGLDRLGRSAQISERIPSDLLLPAVAQGTLALQAREDDPLVEALSKLEEKHAGHSARAERSFLEHLEGDCTVPLAGFCESIDSDTLRFRGLVASLDGQRVARAERTGKATDPKALGAAVAESVLNAGGAEILAELRRGETGA
ncbi:MAG: hydroxymethylbilane synthase [Deltaproteobacteria bacterium]|nr:hydroxymethylbilane synthase [Deltaproteobacteria bacterium]